MATNCDTNNTRSKRMAETGDKLLHSNSLVFTYLRSIVSSQASGWTDMLIGFVLFSWAGLTTWLSTAIGAFCGGIVNCILNYKFTFHADNCDWRAVSTKYVLVWIGSMLLNAFGTQAIYNLMSSMPWLETLGFKPDGYYATARIFTSLVVSLFWNFVLQRYFVYRPTRLDPYFVKFLYVLGVRLKTDKK